LYLVPTRQNYLHISNRICLQIVNCIVNPYPANVENMVRS
jgi:hypothetical protein